MSTDLYIYSDVCTYENFTEMYHKVVLFARRNKLTSQNWAASLGSTNYTSSSLQIVCYYHFYHFVQLTIFIILSRLLNCRPSCLGRVLCSTFIRTCFDLPECVYYLFFRSHYTCYFAAKLPF